MTLPATSGAMVEISIALSDPTPGTVLTMVSRFTFVEVTVTTRSGCFLGASSEQPCTRAAKSTADDSRPMNEREDGCRWFFIDQF